MMQYWWDHAVASEQVEGAIDLVRHQTKTKNMDNGFEIEEGKSIITLVIYLS